MRWAVRLPLEEPALKGAKVCYTPCKLLHQNSSYFQHTGRAKTTVDTLQCVGVEFTSHDAGNIVIVGDIDFIQSVLFVSLWNRNAFMWPTSSMFLRLGLKRGTALVGKLDAERFGRPRLCSGAGAAWRRAASGCRLWRQHHPPGAAAGWTAPGQHAHLAGALLDSCHPRLTAATVNQLLHYSLYSAERLLARLQT